MKRPLSFLIMFCFLALGLAGCDFVKKQQAALEKKSAAPVIAAKGPIVAKVNNLPLTLEDLNAEIEAYNAVVPADRPELKIDTRDKKIKYLKEEMVRRALLYQAAKDKGLERSEEVQRALEKAKMDILIVAFVKEETGKVNVASSEIENYYNTYKDQLKEATEYRIREMALASEQEAKDLLILLLQGGDFAALAKERSKAKSAQAGGDLGFIEASQIPKEMAAVVNSLEPGQVSSVFKGPAGYYIIKLEAIRGGKQKPLSEMWDDIKRGLIFLKQQQKIEEDLANLSRDAKIELYESQIK